MFLFSLGIIHMHQRILAGYTSIPSHLVTSISQSLREKEGMNMLDMIQWTSKTTTAIQSNYQ